MPAATIPVNADQRQGVPARRGARRAPRAPDADQREGGAGDHRHGQDPAHRLLGRDRRIAVAADRHEDRLADGRERAPGRSRRRRPGRPRRRRSARRRRRGPCPPSESAERRRPAPPSSHSCPRAIVDDGDERRVGVEAEQDEGDRRPVEGEEHRDVEDERRRRRRPRRPRWSAPASRHGATNARPRPIRHAA